MLVVCCMCVCLVFGDKLFNHTIYGATNDCNVILPHMSSP